jgi:RHS repeat-associated protein
MGNSKFTVRLPEFDSGADEARALSGGFSSTRTTTGILQKNRMGVLVLCLLGSVAHADPVPAGGPLLVGIGYDADGRRTTVNLPKGVGQPDARDQVLFYDGLGRVTSSTLAAPSPGASAPVVKLTYDGQDRIKYVEDPRSSAQTPIITSYTTNGLGDTANRSSPDSGLTTFTYNSDGSIATRKDARGKTAVYGYDDAGRLTSVTFTSGKANTYTYDGGTPGVPNNSTGQLSKFTDESGNTTYTHDGLGRVLTKVQVTKVGPSNLSFTLSQVWLRTAGSTTQLSIQKGKLASLTYPSLARLNYIYDNVGQLQAITLDPVNSSGTATSSGQSVTILSGLAYTPTREPSGWTWGSGVANLRGFDSAGRLRTYQLGNPLGTGAAEGLTRTLGYDDAGRITSYTHTSGANGVAKPAFDQSFGYDGLDRVTQNTQATSSYSYEYDLSNNRTKQGISGATTTNTIATNSNRLMTEGGTPATNFVYNDDGSISSDGSFTTSYSDRGRLASFTKGSTSTSFLYNALEQRTVKSSSSGVAAALEYVYDEEGHLIGEYDSAGVPVYEVVYLNDIPVAVIKQTRTGTGGSQTVATSVSYIYADHIQTPRVIVRSSDHAIQWRWDQAEAFGNVPPIDNPNGLGQFTFNLRFPGQLFDTETGWAYNLNRDYRPKSGRYVQSDPIGLAGGINTYTYVGGNPISGIDPTGLSPADVQKIFDTFNSTVNSMTAGGSRNTNPYINNLSSSLNRATGGLAGKPYLGCADQEAVTRDQLQKRAYEDTWTFTQQSNLVHRWGEARSSNPADPVIVYDPWRGTINTKP